MRAWSPSRRGFSLVVATAAACFNPSGETDATTSATTTAMSTTTGPVDTTTTGTTATDAVPTTAGTPEPGPLTTTGATPTATTGPGESSTGAPATSSTTSETGTTTDSTGDETAAPPGICGDGVLTADEECDPGDVTLGCGIDCKRNARFVFVTSMTFTGSEVMGTTAADAYCDAVAPTTPGFQDTQWVAWLSTPTLPPAGTRVTSAAVPFIRLDGTIVANNKAGFVSDKHSAPINVTEQLLPLAPGEDTCPEPGNMVWTGTGTTGLQSLDHCSQWTANNGLKTGRAGRAQIATAGWTAAGCLLTCDTKAHLYCVENLL